MNVLERFKVARATREHYTDFLEFVYDALAFLGFDITDMQADIAEFMQRGPRFRAVFAQRSEAKSTIACIYGLWRIVQMPSTRVVTVSASAPKAEENGKLMHGLLYQWPVLAYLRPDKAAQSRTSVTQFDVHHTLKGIDKSASVYCLGITGQMTGFRADVLIADDIEVANNSMSASERAKLLERSKEFSSICSDGDILYLGTPQTKDSIYNTLPARGFLVRIWPGRFPSAEHMVGYGDRLAPSILVRMQNDPSLTTGGGLDGTRGKPTDPARIDEQSLQDKELDQGPETFELQYMLNTKLMDASRQQLNLRDLVVLEVGGTRVPEVIEWAPSPQTRVELPVNFPATGVELYKPGFVSTSYGELQQLTMCVDPSAGGDEVAYAVGGALGPYIHLLEWGGLRGGMSEDTMTKLLDIAAERGVREIVIERNMGAGIATLLMQAHAAKLQRKIGISDMNSTGQKERRIIDLLAPIMRRHRLVVHQSAIDSDLETTLVYSAATRSTYSGFAQMDGITTDRGSLVHDDRIDVLEQLCRKLSTVVVQDEHRAANARRERMAMEFFKNPMDIPNTTLRSRQRGGPAYLARRF